MEIVNVISIIHANYKAFTKAEQKVADFVLKDPKQIFYISITDFADMCGVGDTSVFRFCKTLGFNGYQEFKMMLAQSLNNDDQSGQLNEEIKKDDSIEDLCKKVLIKNTNALNETFDLLNMSDLTKSVDYIIDAKRILFLGLGSSAITAHEAKNRFLRVTPKVEFVYDAHMQSMATSLMTKDDLVIAFSFSGSTKDMIELLKISKSTGCKIICITRFAKSPITKYADIVLLCGAHEGPLQGGDLSAKMAQLYLLDILFSEYTRKTGDLSKKNSKKTAESVSNKLV